jgi:hypothetical protein
LEYQFPLKLEQYFDTDIMYYHFASLQATDADLPRKSITSSIFISLAFPQKINYGVN